MSLARVVEIKRYAGVCSDHPYWATPPSMSQERIEKLVREHNDNEHQGVQSLDE